MASDDEDELIIRFDKNGGNDAFPETTFVDTTNYMAIHHKARMLAQNPDFIEQSVRTTRKPRLKMTSQLLLAPHGLALLAKQCRLMRQKRQQGNEGIQLARLVQMYDDWAHQLCPGYDLGVFYSKTEKMGAERNVRELTEALIAGRNVEALETLQPHTAATETIIEEHRNQIIQKRNTIPDDDDEIELSIEEDETTKTGSRGPVAPNHAPTNVSNVQFDEGDYAEPEGLDLPNYDDDDDF